MFPLARHTKPKSGAHVVRPPACFTRAGGRFGPSQILALSPAAWFRFGVGITVATGVSQWDDQSGNARHLKQAVAGNQPAKQADNSILFDGVAHYLKCDAFTLNQPESVYILGRQVTWTLAKHLYDGNANITGRVLQVTATPAVGLGAGGTAIPTSAWTVNTYGVVAAVINGAASSLQISNGTLNTGDPGASNMGGFTLCARADATLFGNMQIKEVIIFPAAHDAATRSRVISYLLSL